MAWWPEIIAARALPRRAVNGRRAGPPATQAALLLSCLMLPHHPKQSHPLVTSEPLGNCPWSMLGSREWGGEGALCFAEGVPRQWLVLFWLCPWPCLQSWRRSQGRDEPPFCLSHMAMTCHHVQHKLLHPALLPNISPSIPPCVCCSSPKREGVKPSPSL